MLRFYTLHQKSGPCVLRWRYQIPTTSRFINRFLATVPSSGPDPNLVGQCNINWEEEIPRQVPLSSSMRLAHATTSELRDEFLQYFRSKQHTVVAPASVFPKENEGSYFINAGMNQFKPLFLCQSTVNLLGEFGRLRRATNCQPCIRVGGRLDDLNDVGYDRQHHTMFEMLGSWSFGDYYKEDACRFMWNFVTKVLGIPTNAIYISYFGGCSHLGLPPDDETRDIWLNLGVRDQKLLPFDSKHNFWRAGQASGAGLCGPSTELHVDFAALGNPDGLRCARCLINSGNPQVIELWNSVFITHRLLPSSDGQFRADLLEPLPRPMVDTGMGLERLACVMQGVTSTYDTDSFLPLMDLIRSEASTSSYTPPSYGGAFLPFCRQLGSADSPQSGETNPRSHMLSDLIKKLFGSNRARKPSCSSRQCMDRHPVSRVNLSDEDRYADLLENWHRDTAYRLLADHSRALAYALSDGMLPGRQGLSLKLRQLIQRATRAAVLTGLQQPDRPTRSILGSLVAMVAERESLMTACAYPAVHGPDARKPSVLSSKEMCNLVDKEVQNFLPKLDNMETAFGACLSESPDINRLSAEQVDGLMRGAYGAPISWDLICAQSQWAGLCLPDVHPQQSQKSSHQLPSKSVTLSRQFHEANIPATDESPKFNRTQQCSTHVFPSCKAELVGVVLNPMNSSDSIIIPRNSEISETRSLLTAINSLTPQQTGLVFNRSNYHAGVAESESDVGSILFNSESLKVDWVQRIPDLLHSGCAWLVHWFSFDGQHFQSLLDQLWSASVFELVLNEQRRFHLMQHRTGQQLLSWAMECYLHQHHAVPETASLNIHGAAIHPDHLTLDVAIVDSESIDWREFTRGVESLCRTAINAGFPITSKMLDSDALNQLPRIRRYPWISYPVRVTAMCIEPTEESKFTLGLPSIELSTSPHLDNTRDLLDLVITSVRGRRQVVKHFTAVVGTAACDSRLHAEKLLAEARRLMEQPPSAETKRDVLRLTNLLNHPTSSAVPFWAREEMHEILERLRRVIPMDKTKNEVDAIASEIAAVLNNAASTVFVLNVKSGVPANIAHALLKHKPKQSVILCSGKIAVLYSAESSEAFQIAQEIAEKFDHELNHVDSFVKARPLRTASIPETERSHFAILELQASPSLETCWLDYEESLRTNACSVLSTLDTTVSG